MSAGETTEGGGDFLTGVASILEAYEEMEMPLERYLLWVIAPALSFFVFTLVATLQAPLPMAFRIPIPALGLLAVFAAVVYPKLARDKRRAEIGDQLHLFITHMTVLSTTNIDRVEVFRTLANEEEYGALADEMTRIVELVDTWNQSLDDACRMRANQIPNPALSDFLDRLAYTLNAGQELGDFLLSEQDIVIRNYATHYRSSLDNLEVLKDLYLSMIMSMTFALVFATVLPILIGTNPTYLIAAVLVLFFLVQVGFLYVVRTLTPNDPVWFQTTDRRTAYDNRVLAAVAVGVVSIGIIVALGFAAAMNVGPLSVRHLARVPMPFYIAVPITPLLLPGIVLRREEARIRERDDEFASFIRALGASESVKQSTTSQVLSTLRTRDFGALTPNIDDLYKRLNIRIDTKLAWTYFAAETRSYLIQKFSEMYVLGREMGGDPKVLGELISENMNEVLQLREQRAQATVTFIGLLYGLSAAATFAFFIGLEIVDVLASISADIHTPEMGMGRFIHPGVYDIPLIEFLLLLVVLGNSMVSSIMIRVADRGHLANAYMHFVLLTWTGATVAWITRTVVGTFLSVG